MKFKVQAPNSWEPHKTPQSVILKVIKPYISLCESERCTTIIEHDETISIMFHVQGKESIEILNNFI